MKRIPPNFHLPNECTRCYYRTHAWFRRCPICGGKIKQFKFWKFSDSPYNPIKKRTLRKIFSHHYHFALKDKRYRR